MNVLDASVLIAIISADDEHHATALALIDHEFEDGFCASALTMAESLVGAVRAGLLPQAMAILEPLDIEVLPLTNADVAHVARTRVTSGLKLPDAVVLAVASGNGRRILTFDRALAEAARRQGLTVLAG